MKKDSLFYTTKRAAVALKEHESLCPVWFFELLSPSVPTLDNPPSVSVRLFPAFVSGVVVTQGIVFVFVLCKKSKKS